MLPFALKLALYNLAGQNILYSLLNVNKEVEVL
jgi:hypothetical protein